MAETETGWKRVVAHYDRIARAGSACCDGNYSPEELAVIPADAVLGEGSGNPVRHADLREGEVVLDLGSGAGIDVFLAASRIGPAGRAIGVDMTPAMIRRAREIVAREGIANVEFHQSVIEALPLEHASVDVVLSNCVINLSPDKVAVYREAFRVLRPGGRLVISDIVQERPLEQVNDECGCLENALLRTDYLETIRAAGFEEVEILEDHAYLIGAQGVDASAITLRAVKPTGPSTRERVLLPTDVHREGRSPPSSPRIFFA